MQPATIPAWVGAGGAAVCVQEDELVDALCDKADTVAVDKEAEDVVNLTVELDATRAPELTACGGNVTDDVVSDAADVGATIPGATVLGGSTIVLGDKVVLNVADVNVGRIVELLVVFAKGAETFANGVKLSDAALDEDAALETGSDVDAVLLPGPNTISGVGNSEVELDSAELNDDEVPTAANVVDSAGVSTLLKAALLRSELDDSDVSTGSMSVVVRVTTTVRREAASAGPKL